MLAYLTAHPLIAGLGVVWAVVLAWQAYSNRTAIKERLFALMPGAKKVTTTPAMPAIVTQDLPAVIGQLLASRAWFESRGCKEGADAITTAMECAIHTHAPVSPPIISSLPVSEPLHAPSATVTITGPGPLSVSP